jgi:hypothetical protein
MSERMKAEKIAPLLEKIREGIDSGRYVHTRHATKRQNERSIIVPDILYVLRKGYHEKKKDSWDKRCKTWCYSIRGKTIDGAELRIIVSFDKNGMLIITVIRLGKMRKL